MKISTIGKSLKSVCLKRIPTKTLGIKLIRLKVVVRCRYLLNPSAILCFASNYFVKNFVPVIPQRFIL